MIKLRKRLMVILLSILTIFVLFVLFEHVRGKRAYKTLITELLENGEKLEVEDFLPYKPDDSENAAIELIELAKELPDVENVITGNLFTMPFLEPGLARPSYTSSEWHSLLGLAPEESGAIPWQEIRQELETSPVSLADIQTTLQKPYLHTGFSYTNGFYETLVLSEYLQYRRFLRASALVHLRDSDSEQAIDSLKVMLSLVQKMENERLVIAQLVRRTLATICFQLTWNILTVPDLSVDQCESLISAWKEIKLIEPMAFSLEMERAMTLDTQQRLKHFRTERVRHFGEMEKAESGDIFPELYDLPTSGWILHWIHIPLWRAAWMDHDFAYGIQQWNNIIDPARLAWNGSWADAENNFNTVSSTGTFLDGINAEGLNWFQRSRFLTSANPGISLNGGLVRQIMQGQSEQQMALAALALHSYKLQTGSYPESLNDLVPEYLNEIPKDYMDGENLRYQKAEDGNFLLYSVGDDTENAGGNPEPIGDAELYTTIWDGRDAVWPQVFQETDSRD